MLYEVIKEFTYTVNGRDYTVGEVVEIGESVQGLVNRGILRKVQEAKPAPKPKKDYKDFTNVELDPNCKATNCVVSHLDSSPEYDGLKSVTVEKVEHLVEELDIPAVKGYTPTEILKHSQTESTTKVKSASEKLEQSNKRAAKQVEMDEKMTSLVEEVEQAKKPATPIKGRRGRKKK